MPSVGMRRTTRVFGARVLRSGRQLSTADESEEDIKCAKHGDEWIELLDNAGDGGIAGDAPKCNQNGWLQNDGAPEQEAKEMDIDVDAKPMAEPKAPVPESTRPGRRWGAVYSRKRKRADMKPVERHVAAEGDRRYGKHFVRRKKVRTASVKDSDKLKDSQLSPHMVIVNTSHGGSYWVSCLLNRVLRYLRRSTVSLLQIFGFINSKPLRDVYSLHGILLLQDQGSRKNKSGACFISGVVYSIPIFTLDFSTVPGCFMNLHSSLLVRSIPMSYALVMYSTVTVEEVRVINDKETEKKQYGLDVVASETNDSKNITRVHSTNAVAHFAGRHFQLRSSCSRIQKGRSSLRSKRGSGSSFAKQSSNGILASDRLRLRRDGFRFSTRRSHYELRSAGQKTPTPSVKELKSALVELTQDIDSTSCSANILVIEHHKGYREKGAVISLELSNAKHWVIAVKVRGVRRYNLTAEKVMRPYSPNRVTHDIIWVAQDGHTGWKLEFPDRRDWLIFKELYKECFQRNLKPQTASIIPVPGVREVLDYAEINPAQFAMPDSYITVRDDELARALARNTANYDMDCDDEAWLTNFNDQLGLKNELSVESFELLIDTFEKSSFCNPDDYSDEKAAINSCLDIEKKEIIEAVYTYWFTKKKQKRSSLIRIFQCYQPRRTQVIPNSILRKKRSFKRQGSKAGRGKPRTFLQAMAAERDTLQQQSAVLKVEEAKAAANKSEEMAVRMRLKAQQMMENADLATYKAMMALKIAEAAKIAKSTEALASFFLG